MPQLRLPRFVVGFCLALTVTASAWAQTPYPTGQSLFGDNDLTKFTNTNTAQSAFSSVAVSGVPDATTGWELQTKADLSNPWDVQLIRGIPRAVATGDVTFIRFYARMTATAQESGGAFLTVYAQSGAPNYDKSLSQEVFLTAEWQEFMLPFAWKAGYAANASSIVFAAGYRHQTIQISALDMVYYGTSVALSSLPRSKPTYVGREASAPWRAAAAARIEQIRKGDFAINVVDADGKPVGNATVTVAMKRHAFQFGSALVLQRLVDQTSADSRTYQQKVLELFNAGSPENDLKAPAWQGDWGTAFNQTQTLNGLQWLKDRGISMRGHVLEWPSWRNSPKSITSLHDSGQDSKIPDQILANIASVMDPTRDLVVEWDVENEPYDNHDIMDMFGRQIQGDWFVAARQHHPTARLFLNDYANDDIDRHATKIASFESNVNYIKSLGVPITGIGLQGHMGAVPTPPANFIATLDRYQANIGLPVRITEYDVNSDDEDLQADYLRDFYTAAFSHPSVIGVQMWGFWEKQHWIKQAAMYREDWTPKPAALAYKKLLFETWWTNVSGTSDSAGAFNGRGFYGDYEVTVKVGSQTVRKTMRLEPGTAQTTLQVPMVDTRLVNVSTLGNAMTGDKTLIGGFSVSGSTPKAILVRGIGPRLTGKPFNLAGMIPHPRTTLYSGGQPLGVFGPWDDAAEVARVTTATTAVGAYPLQPAGDSAFVRDLAEGSYSVFVEDTGGETGLATFEVYETGKEGRITNLSTRVFVGNGHSAIAGFSTVGPTARRLLVRAVGPGIARAPFNVSGTLARPSMKLYRGASVIAANNDWRTNANVDDLKKAFNDTGAFALNANDPDAALLVTAEEGTYTAIVDGADGGSGVVILEIYLLPE